LIDGLLNLHDQIRETPLGANREAQIRELESLALTATPTQNQKGLMR
jgi:NADH-quinone oxidoreductase subunit B